MTAAPSQRLAQSDPSPHGVNVHVAPDHLLEELARIGVRWVRIDIDWESVEPSPGFFVWGEIDRVIVTASRLGMSVLASLAYCPAWASADRRRTGAPRDANRWTELVAAVLERHRDRIAAVSMWNEPNLRQFYTGKRDAYLRDILRRGLETAQRMAPDCVRVGPDLSSSPSGGDPLGKWLGPVLDTAGGLLDVISHHQYDGHDTLAGRVESLDRLHGFLDKRGIEQPVWVTEIGWDTGGRAAAGLQATLLRGTFAEMESRPWWSKTFWYDSHGPVWGLFEPDAPARRGEPRPAFGTYANVIHVARV